MPVRYYPSFRIIPNQITRGTDFLLNGRPYTGLYYKTYDNKQFSGPNPAFGLNEELVPIPKETITNTGLRNLQGSQGFKTQMANTTKFINSLPKDPVSYYPKLSQTDYDLGYINRYFAKRKNNNGYITEISPAAYSDILNGAVGYDTEMLQTQVIAWKLKGPLRSIRISQYDTKAGIIDTNERLVKAANPNFFGLIEFIGGQYDKFAKPTL